MLLCIYTCVTPVHSHAQFIQSLKRFLPLPDRCVQMGNLPPALSPAAGLPHGALLTPLVRTGRVQRAPRPLAVCSLGVAAE